MRGKRLLAVTVLLAVLVLAIPSCAKPAALPPVKIALIAPLTGPVSVDGLLMAQNAELAARIANEKGGILGGRKIEILRYDDKCLPEEAAAMARKAIEVDKVKGITGLWETACVAAVKPVAREHKIPVVVGNGSGVDYMADWYPGWVHHCDQITFDTKGMVTKMETDPKLKTIAMVWEDMAFTRDGSDILHKRWDVPGSPVKIVGEIWHPLGKSELKAEYTKAAGFNPDAIFVSEWSPPCIIAGLTALSEIGYKGVIFVGTPLARKAIIDAVGKAAEGVNVTCTLMEDPAVPENVAYCTRHRKEVSEDIYFIGMMEFEATQILIQAMDKAGTDSDAEKFDKAVRTLDYTDLSGCKMKLTPQGMVIRERAYLAQVQGGKLVFLEYVPLEMADYEYFLR